MSQKKILVVDDDPDVRLALQVRLNANNYHVICAGDGVTSMSRLKSAYLQGQHHGAVVPEGAAPRLGTFLVPGG
jgi:DNA-binding response OmpR family regulator